MIWTPKDEEELFRRMWAITPPEYRPKSNAVTRTPGQCLDCNRELDSKKKVRCSECREKHRRKTNREYMRKVRQ